MPLLAPEGGLVLALVRAGFVTAVLSGFGTLLFRVAVAPRALLRAEPGVPDRVDRVLLRLARASLWAAVGLLPLWLVLQAAEIADTTTVGESLRAAWLVLRGTVFGHVLALQGAALAATAVALRWDSRRWAAGLAGLLAALEAGHGHALAVADGPSILLGAGIVHLWAAGAWLGGLLPLLLVVRVAPPRTAAAAARWFSPLGKWCVVLLAGSAAFQFWELVGGVPGLLGTAYGWTTAAKVVLFAVLLGFACLNRYGFAPRLLGGSPGVAPGAVRRALVRSIAVQTAAGLAAVLAAAVLSSFPPAVHEQPVWPFPVRPSLLAMSDPDLRGEVLQGAGELFAGLFAVAMGIVVWRRRWLALTAVVAGLLVGSASASHLDLLFVEAYPTSYFHSPTGFAATGIVHGGALFPGNCASCHGAGGKGDGPLAAQLPVPPADLTAPHLWEHADGELFWWLAHGMEAPDGTMAMPGFADRLSDDDRWALIDFIRARNAGAALGETGSWPAPVPAPAFGMTCPGKGAVSTEDLRGSVLHLVAEPPGGGPVPSAPEPGPAPVVTVLMANGPLPDHPATCVTTDPAVWNAYAVLSGIPGDHLAGAQFLVDPDGWMRAAQRPGEAVRWADPALLLADIQAICRHPLAAPGNGHVHH